MEDMPFIQGEKARKWVFELVKENTVLKQENKKMTEMMTDAKKEREERMGRNDG